MDMHMMVFIAKTITKLKISYVIQINVCINANNLISYKNYINKNINDDQEWTHKHHLFFFVLHKL